jgi:hypothetical protein
MEVSACSVDGVVGEVSVGKVQLARDDIQAQFSLLVTCRRVNVDSQ